MEKIVGLILNISNYKNSDCIFNILTKNELIPVLGKGSLNIKNKTNRLNNPFIYGEFDLYKGPTLGYKLRDCKVYEHFNERFVTYEDHIIFDFLSELLFKVIINSNSYDGYLDTIVNALSAYKNKSNKYDTIITLFGNLFKINGLCLNTKSCVNCGNVNENDFVSIDFINGGVVCKNCLNNCFELMDKDDLEIYKDIFETESITKSVDLNLDKEKFLKVIKNLNIFLNSSLDINLKSIKLLKTI